jgi:hypothetical protein
LDFLPLQNSFFSLEGRESFETRAKADQRERERESSRSTILCVLVEVQGIQSKRDSNSSLDLMFVDSKDLSSIEDQQSALWNEKSVLGGSLGNVDCICALEVK